MVFGNDRILSIQSHVVSGYVGNKCCVLPLQVLGNDVDSINSVQFSNHTNYKYCKGQILNSDDIKDLYEGLKLNNLVNYSSVITGYIGSKTFLEEVCNIVGDIKQTLPSAKYYCDPVMGDNGKLYVASNLLKVYQTKVLPLADVLFPNQFEAELLTDMEIKNEKDIYKTMDIFHQQNIKTVIITSSNLGSDDYLYGYGSKMNEDGSRQTIRMEIPKFPYNFVGTGDLFASLFLAWSIKCPDNFQMVCSKVIGSMQIVLRRTVEKFENLKSEGFDSECFGLELNIVQCIPDLLDPLPFSNISDISL